jgi:uncharacterized protein
MLDIQQLRDFVSPFYVHKDLMHDLGHIERVLQMALSLSEPYEHQVNKELIIYGAYFHGVIRSTEIHEQIIQYLKSQELNQNEIESIIQVALESQKEEIPQTLEGKILHDAHLFEGGKTFLIVKSLITGSLRGQSLEETVQYIERSILDQFTCALPENHQIYKEKEEFARQFLNDLKPYL